MDEKIQIESHMVSMDNDEWDNREFFLGQLLKVGMVEFVADLMEQLMTTYKNTYSNTIHV